MSTKTERLQKEVETLKRERAEDAIRAAGGSTALLLPHVLQRMRDEDESPTDAVAALQKEEAFAPAFGAGAPQEETEGPPEVDVREMTEDEKADFIDEHGLGAWQEALAESYA